MKNPVLSDCYEYARSSCATIEIRIFLNYINRICYIIIYYLIVKVEDKENKVNQYY